MNPHDELIKELIRKTHFAIDDIEVHFDDDTGSYWYQIRTPEPNYFLGKNGETLSALNHLARRMIEKNSPVEQKPKEYFIDVNHFQKRKIDNLKAIAHMMAERARFFKSNIEIDPMSAYERKIVHMFLEGKNDLATESKGEGKDRRVVIKYIGSI